MKRKILTAITIGAILLASGCGNTADPADNIATVGNAEENRDESDTTTEDPSTETEETTEAGESGGSSTGNVLVAYFSWADNAVLDEEVDTVTSPSVIPPGNVQQLAGWVQEETGGDLKVLSE